MYVCAKDAMPSIKKNIFYNVLLSVMSLIFPLITYPYVARILGVEIIGKTNFANSFTSYFLLISNLGIPIYGLREIAKAKEDRGELNRVFSEMFFLCAIMTAMALILYMLTFVFITKVRVDWLLYAIVGINIFMNVFSLDWFYGGMEDYQYISLRSLLVKALSIAALFFFVRSKADWYIYVLIGVVATSGANIFNILHSRKYTRLRIKDIGLKKHLRPIFWIFGNVVAITLYLNINITLLGFFEDDVQVGYFSTAFRLVLMILTVVHAFNAVLVPRVSSYVKKDMQKEYWDSLSSLFNAIGIIAIPSVCGLLILSKTIIRVFAGNDFTPAYLDMMILSPVIVLSGISNAIGNNLFLPNGKEKLLFLTSIIGTIICIALDIVLIPIFKSRGAGVSLLAAEASMLAFQLYLLRFKKILKEKTPKIKMNLHYFLLASVFMSVGVLLVAFLIQNEFLRLSIGVVVGVGVYLITLILMKEKTTLALLEMMRMKVKTLAKK
jgi:O-antigen/teichoic acid export membrane protein